MIVTVISYNVTWKGRGRKLSRMLEGSIRTKVRSWKGNGWMLNRYAGSKKFGRFYKMVWNDNETKSIGFEFQLAKNSKNGLR